MKFSMNKCKLFIFLSFWCVSVVWGQSTNQDFSIYELEYLINNNPEVVSNNGLSLIRYEMVDTLRDYSSDFWVNYYNDETLVPIYAFSKQDNSFQLLPVLNFKRYALPVLEYTLKAAEEFALPLNIVKLYWLYNDTEIATYGVTAKTKFFFDPIITSFSFQLINKVETVTSDSGNSEIKYQFEIPAKTFVYNGREAAYACVNINVYAEKQPDGEYFITGYSTGIDTKTNIGFQLSSEVSPKSYKSGVDGHLECSWKIQFMENDTIITNGSEPFIAYKEIETESGYVYITSEDFKQQEK